jgi:hypothetical protein
MDGRATSRVGAYTPKPLTAVPNAVANQKAGPDGHAHGARLHGERGLATGMAEFAHAELRVRANPLNLVDATHCGRDLT